MVKTSHVEKEIPYSEETIREAVTLLEEYPSIEGKGKIKVIRASCGAVGCVVAPFTIQAVPLLFYLAFGEVRLSDFVSGTRGLYRHVVDLIPMEESRPFDVVQDRGGEVKYYPACRVKGFELRTMREETIKLKLDIQGEKAPIAYSLPLQVGNCRGERFRGENVKYIINGNEYKNIYGITLSSKKKGGTKTEMWIRRALERGADIPEIIDELVIEAKLLRDEYEHSRFGMFRITVKRMVLVSNETAIECDDTVIGPLRFYVSGVVSAEVFTSTGDNIA